MAESHESTTEHAGDNHHDDHGSLKRYFAVFIALCVLTTMSFLTYFDFWRENVDVRAGWTLMMAVSIAKASLVMLFFMHLKYEANWKYVLTIPASIMAVFLTLALIPDIARRYSTIFGGRTVAPQQERFLPEAPVEEADDASEAEGH